MSEEKPVREIEVELTIRWKTRVPIYKEMANAEPGEDDAYAAQVAEERFYDRVADGDLADQLRTGAARPEVKILSHKEL